MRRVALTGGRVLVASGELAEATLLLEGAQIAGLLSPGEPLPADVVRIDVKGCTVAPGFIETHIHGGAGRNFMEGTPGALAAISRHIARGGATSCLATTTCADASDLLRAVGWARAASRRPEPGLVEVLGIHTEGPYLNPHFGGALVARQIRPVARAELETLWEVAGSAWKVVTLAPEMPGGMEAVRFLAGKGIQVSMGHTGATYEEAKAALAQGVRRGTHLFNAMPPIHHRAPGPVPALLEDESVFVEIIADGKHLHPAVVKMVIDRVGLQRAVAVTDCNDAAGRGDGPYVRWGDIPVVVENGEVRTAAGSLAGSTLSMGQAVRNLVRLVGVPLPAALRMASESPARSIGLQNRKGSLLPGRDADVVVLDEDLQVVLTIARGITIYQRECAKEGA